MNPDVIKEFAKVYDHLHTMVNRDEEILRMVITITSTLAEIERKLRDLEPYQ